jgi:hypothetical protein
MTMLSSLAELSELGHEVTVAHARNVRLPGRPPADSLDMRVTSDYSYGEQKANI